MHGEGEHRSLGMLGYAQNLSYTNLFFSAWVGHKDHHAQSLHWRSCCWIKKHYVVTWYAGLVNLIVQAQIESLKERTSSTLVTLSQLQSHTSPSHTACHPVTPYYTHNPIAHDLLFHTNLKASLQYFVLYRSCTGRFLRLMPSVMVCLTHIKLKMQCTHNATNSLDSIGVDVQNRQGCYRSLVWLEGSYTGKHSC